MTYEQVEEVRKDFARGGRLTDLCDSHNDQAATIARLERELAEVKRVRDAAVAANTAEVEGHRLTIADHRRQTAEMSAKAEALDALVERLQGENWINSMTMSNATGTYFANWREESSVRRLSGSGPTLPAAIMDALQKAGQ